MTASPILKDGFTQVPITSTRTAPRPRVFSFALTQTAQFTWWMKAFSSQMGWHFLLMAARCISQIQLRAAFMHTTGTAGRETYPIVAYSFAFRARKASLTD